MPAGVVKGGDRSSAGILYVPNLQLYVNRFVH